MLTSRVTAKGNAGVPHLLAEGTHRLSIFLFMIFDHISIILTCASIMRLHRHWTSVDFMDRQGSTTVRRRTAKLIARPVARATLPEEVYRRIKDLILDGNLAPGELVTIQGLAEAFDVSTMPVREALTRLTAERALTVIAGRSVGIPNLDTRRLQDLTRVRLAIETTAARWAAEGITADQVAELDSLCATMDGAIKEDDRRGFVRANHDFHFVIYRAANSQTVLGIIEALWLQVSPYFHLLHASDNYTTSNAQHRRILDALKSHDGDGVAAALHGDISAASAMLTKLLA